MDADIQVVKAYMLWWGGGTPGKAYSSLIKMIDLAVSVQHRKAQFVARSHGWWLLLHVSKAHMDLALAVHSSVPTEVQMQPQKQAHGKIIVEVQQVASSCIYFVIYLTFI